MEGEGLADSIPFKRLLSLLNTSVENLLYQIKQNIESGFLETEGAFRK